MVHHVYVGRRCEKGQVAVVTCDGQPFDHGPSCKVANHSPTGFEWGYGGSGPAQLALALLLEVTDEETAMELHHEFKWTVVAAFAKAGFRIGTGQIREWVRSRVGLTG
jgi:hypothetical protein